MEAPDKIYIFQDGDEHWYKSEEWETPPPNRVEYIRKDALLEWVRLAYGKLSMNTFDVQNVFEELIDKIK